MLLSPRAFQVYLRSSEGISGRSKITFGWCPSWCVLGPSAELRGGSSFARPGLQARAVARVVPLAVKGMGLAGHGSEFGIGDLDASRIAARVPHGANGESAAGGGRCDEINDDVMTDEGPPSPVHRDMAEEPVLNAIPLRRAGREVTDRDRQARPFRQGAELSLPQPGAVAVGAPGVGGDQQPGGVGIGD